MATKKQKDKAFMYMRRAGYWNEGIGFVFLALAALAAYGLNSSDLGSLFFIGLFGSLTKFLIFLWIAVGAAYVITGYYLHAVQGRLVKPALWVTAVLSVVAIRNIIPIIPLVFSVYALVKLRGTAINTKRTKSKSKPFDVRDYPALSIMVIFAILAVVWTGMGTHRAAVESAKHADASKDIHMNQKVNCVAVPELPGSCGVNDTALGFKVVFPVKDPHLDSYPGNNSAYEVNADNGKKGQYKFYEYSGSTNKAGADKKQQYATYSVKVLDYGTTLDQAALGDQFSQIQKNRLLEGKADNFLCELPGDNVVSGDDPQTTTASTYSGLPALQTRIPLGKEFQDSTCSFYATTFISGPRTYSVSYTSVPGNASSADFDSFLQSFSLTE